MEKPPINPSDGKIEIPKEEQSIESLQFSEQKKNIQEVFKLSPEIKNIALDSVGLDSKLDNYVLELRGQIRKRLRQNSVTEEEINKLTGDGRFVKEHPEVILNLVTNEDIKNLKQAYEDNKNQQLAQYETYKNKYPEDADIVPEIGASISRDTSWWDNKISDLKEYSEKQKEAIELYAEYLKTIFLESKIYYRGDTSNLEEFRYSESTQQIGGVKIGNKNKFGSGIYMTTNKELVSEFANQNEGSIYPVLVDTSKTLSFKDRAHFQREVAKFYKKENLATGKEVDGYTKLQQSQGFNIYIEDSNGSDELVVGGMEKYKILGSKSDVEKFKEFVSNKKILEN